MCAKRSLRSVVLPPSANNLHNRAHSDEREREREAARELRSRSLLELACPLSFHPHFRIFSVSTRQYNSQF